MCMGINMLMYEATPEMIETWKQVWNEYKDKLRPNRKSGTEVIEYLRNKYSLQEIHNEKAKNVVIYNVLDNAPFAEKLPKGMKPSAVTFFVENTGIGRILYEKKDEVFTEEKIFVGVDIVSGYFCVEGSSMLWDELYAFQGLDETDLQNFYCVAEYISCLKRFGMLEDIIFSN